MALLHAHGAGGGIIEILDEVFLHGLLDTLKLVPFLFLTYLLMEFIEHKAADRTRAFMERAGAFGPAIGGALGAVPQCGFSAAASNLYAGRVITLGTIIAVFLSTSDEMIPIFISGSIPVGTVMLVLLYKAACGMLVGFAVDLVIRMLGGSQKEINIDEICDNDNCHCERGIFYSAVHHTLTISAFVLLITIAINALVYFVGAETIGEIMYDKPFVSHLLAAIFGLVPNCAVSVALTTLCTEGIITAGTMMAGLFSGAGAGLLVLFKVNPRMKDNFIIVAVLLLAGVLFGMLGDVIFPSELFLAK